MDTFGLPVAEEDLHFIRSIRTDLQNKFSEWNPYYGWVMPEHGVPIEHWFSLDAWFFSRMDVNPVEITLEGLPSYGMTKEWFTKNPVSDDYRLQWFYDSRNRVWTNNPNYIVPTNQLPKYCYPPAPAPLAPYPQFGARMRAFYYINPDEVITQRPAIEPIEPSEHNWIMAETIERINRPRPREPVIIYCALEVITHPDNAMVYLNGQFLGYSNTYFQGLNPGNYIILVKKEGYADYSEQITLPPGGDVLFEHTFAMTHPAPPVSPIISPILLVTGGLIAAVVIVKVLRQ